MLPKAAAGDSALSATKPSNAAVQPALAAAAGPAAAGLDAASAQASSAGPVQPLEPEAASRILSAADHRNTAGASDTVANTAAQPADAGSSLDLATSSVPLPPAPAVTTTATVAAPAHADSPASPASQLAPAVLTLAKTSDGNDEMTVRLHPADLGMVQVRIERMASGATQVELTADKADTLQALQKDQIALHRTLDEAGIPAAGRSVTFHLAEPSPGSSGSPGSDQRGGQHAAAGSASDGTDAGGGKGGYSNRENRRWSGGRSAGGSEPLAGAATVTEKQTYRVGLDITA